MDDRLVLGEIERLQVQRSKLGDGRRFSPAPIVAVERLRLTPSGVFGLTDGTWILDRHHRDHPDANPWSEHRTLSVGFTSHYGHMWNLFRPTAIGSAGENVLVRANAIVSPDQIADGVQIECGSMLLELGPVAVAEPCIPFTRFMTDRPDAESTSLKSEREKLRKGVRGFVMGLHNVDRLEITVGDKLSIRSG